MKLHVSGVKVPKLGSIQDRVMRDFLTKQANKEIYKTKLLAQLAISNSKNKEASDEVMETWNNYVNLEAFLEDQSKQRVMDMQEEYAYWKTTKPKLRRTEKGGVEVVGLKVKG